MTSQTPRSHERQGKRLERGNQHDAEDQAVAGSRISISKGPGDAGRVLRPVTPDTAESPFSANTASDAAITKITFDRLKFARSPGKGARVQDLDPPGGRFNNDR